MLKSVFGDDTPLIVEFASASSAAAQADVAAAKMRAHSSSSAPTRTPAPPLPSRPPSVLSILRTLYTGRRSEEEASQQLEIEEYEQSLLTALYTAGLEGYNFTLLELGNAGSAMTLKLARKNPHATVISVDGKASSSLSLSLALSFPHPSPLQDRMMQFLRWLLA